MMKKPKINDFWTFSLDPAGVAGILPDTKNLENERFRISPARVKENIVHLSGDSNTGGSKTPARREWFRVGFGQSGRSGGPPQINILVWDRSPRSGGVRSSYLNP